MRLGVSSYDVSLEKQEVLVTGDIAYDDLLAMIKKTGKEVRSSSVVRIVILRRRFPLCVR